MISILTPSIDKSRLAIVAKAIQNQTHEDWEWLIGSKFDPEIEFATWIKDDFEGGYWTLNRIYNRLFEQARGELVVSWQDNIYTPPASLEAFWDDYIATEASALISGVGDQYSEVDAFLRPTQKCWSDPRKTNKYGSFYECSWNDVEWNWAAIPKDLFWAVGGMDEQLDFLGYGGDQLQVCDRLNDFGARFYLNQANESYTYRHDRSAHGGQKEWDSNHVLFNGTYYRRRDDLVTSDNWPILIDKGNQGVLANVKEVIEHGIS